MQNVAAWSTSSSGFPALQSLEVTNWKEGNVQGSVRNSNASALARFPFHPHPLKEAGIRQMSYSNHFQVWEPTASRRWMGRGGGHHTLWSSQHWTSNGREGPKNLVPAEKGERRESSVLDLQSCKLEEASFGREPRDVAGMGGEGSPLESEQLATRSRKTVHFCGFRFKTKRNALRRSASRAWGSHALSLPKDQGAALPRAPFPFPSRGAPLCLQVPLRAKPGAQPGPATCTHRPRIPQAGMVRRHAGFAAF